MVAKMSSMTDDARSYWRTNSGAPRRRLDLVDHAAALEGTLRGELQPLGSNGLVR
jgi:hypothetical protein